MLHRLSLCVCLYVCVDTHEHTSLHSQRTLDSTGTFFGTWFSLLYDTLSDSSPCTQRKWQRQGTQQNISSPCRVRNVVLSLPLTLHHTVCATPMVQHYQHFTKTATICWTRKHTCTFGWSWELCLFLWPTLEKCSPTVDTGCLWNDFAIDSHAVENIAACNFNCIWMVYIRSCMNITMLKLVPNLAGCDNTVWKVKSSVHKLDPAKQWSGPLINSNSVFTLLKTNHRALVKL